MLCITYGMGCVESAPQRDDVSGHTPVTVTRHGDGGGTLGILVEPASQPARPPRGSVWGGGEGGEGIRRHIIKMQRMVIGAPDVCMLLCVGVAPTGREKGLQKKQMLCPQHPVLL